MQLLPYMSTCFANAAGKIETGRFFKFFREKGLKEIIKSEIHKMSYLLTYSLSDEFTIRINECIAKYSLKTGNMYDTGEYTDTCCRELLVILEEFKIWFEKEFAKECHETEFGKYYIDYTMIPGSGYGDQYMKDSSLQGILFKKIVALNIGYINCRRLRSKNVEKRLAAAKRKEETTKQIDKSRAEERAKYKLYLNDENNIKNGIETGEYDKILYEHNGKEYELKLYTVSKYKNTLEHYTSFIMSKYFQEHIIIRLRTLNGYKTHNIKFPNNLGITSLSLESVRKYRDKLVLIDYDKIDINVKRIFEYFGIAAEYIMLKSRFHLTKDVKDYTEKYIKRKEKIRAGAGARIEEINEDPS